MNRLWSITAAVFISVLGAAMPLSRVHAQQTTTNPHGPLFQDCSTCHASSSWTPAKVTSAFKHPASFPLQGAHGSTTCRSCHVKLDFSGTSGSCASCHEDPHLAELGADCSRCHNTSSFIDRSAMLRSHQVTRFPLAGAHRMADCESCHIPAAQGQRRFTGRPTDCVGCHQQQRLATKEPDHVAAGFSNDCGSCHTPTYWNRAAFDHSGTSFPLTGGHRGVACSACHADGVYVGKSTVCESCHLTDYQNTTNPGHTSAGFPTNCASCHNTNGWQGASFDHDALFFPIYSGAHRGRWSSCATCHTSPTNYSVFTCLTCHERTETDGHHEGESGYAYDSQLCYSCHRNGRAP